MRFSEQRLATLLGQVAITLVCLPSIAPAAPAPSMGGVPSTSGPSAPSAGKESLTRGLELIGKGDLAGAEKALNDSLKLDPALVDAFLALADIRLRQGKLDEAEAFGRKAMAAKPDSPNVLVALGNILLLKKDGAQAEGLYRKALTIDKDHVSAYMGLGELYLRVLNKPKDAVAAFGRAVAISSKLAPAHFALGTAYATANQPKEAIAAFQNAAKLAPTDPQPLHAIGRIQASEKKLDAAVQSFSGALLANTSYLPALVDRADALAELERNKEAVTDYENALTKLPNDAQLWLKLGLVNQRLQRKSEAVKAYQKAVGINSSLALAYNNLAWLTLDEKSNLDQALAWSLKATALAPKVPQFHDTLGWTYHARGDIELAQKTLDAAAKLYPPQADVHYHMGVLLQEQGKKKEAAAAFKQALQINRNFGNSSDANKRLNELSK